MFWYAAIPGSFNGDYFQVLSMRNIKATDNFCVTNYFGSVIPAFTYEEENASRDVCSPPSANPTNNKLWVNTIKIDTWVNATVNFTGH